ncbi:AcrR family transcriptional regulator [Nocardioides daedukensis]|uniref:AcrR family transcriptional regulator n=1 Tax=Nocardioides daedukensis TaxID=634462 RepID=A0A7Y9RZ04_9ACTN|nr:AcrR family transcriptional regulator [Nocardioides daedukensis]
MSTGFDRRTPNRGDERRAALLAALDGLLLAGEGLASITIADVARRAGVTRSAFYFYFPNLPMAVAALVEPLYDDASSATELLLDAQTPPSQRITSMITVLFDSIDRHGYAFRAALEARAADPDLRTVWEEGRDDYARQVARMITAERRAGNAPAGADARALASMLLELNDRAVERYALGSTRPRKHQVAALASIWLRSVYGTDPTPSSRSTR